MASKRLRQFRPMIELLEERRVPALTASISNGVLSIIGTDAPENIVVKQIGNAIMINGVWGRFRGGQISSIFVDACGGNDSIDVSNKSLPSQPPITKPVTVKAGDGNDSVVGGDGQTSSKAGYRATLDGGGGADQLYGQWGNDILFGGTGADSLYGQDDWDVIHGGPDNDTLRGDAGDDHLYGDDANDHLFGESDVDVLKAVAATTN